jgi:hypothetical protein
MVDLEQIKKENEIPQDNEQPKQEQTAVAQVEAKNTLQQVFDKNVSVEDLKESFKKGSILNASQDEQFIKKSSEKVAGQLLDELDQDKSIKDIEYKTKELSETQKQAKEFYDYHNTVLKAVGIETPLSIKQMKFWAIIGSIYYFIQRFIFFVGDIIKTITDAFTKVVKTFFETLADILKSSSKAVKGFGYLLVAMCFIFVVIGVVYIIPKLIGIDIFDIIKGAIKK